MVAGLTTFLTMAYIIFVQPTVLRAAGMDFGAVLVATCLAAAISTLLMGLTGQLPARHRACHGPQLLLRLHRGRRHARAVADGARRCGGCRRRSSSLTAGVGLRERLITAIPSSLKHAIAVGIGLLIALIGLEWGGIIVANPGTFVALGSFSSPATLLTIAGLS